MSLFRLKGALRFRFTVLRSPSYNTVYTAQNSARPSPTLPDPTSGVGVGFSQKLDA